ncbi:hypothetical protein ACTWP5_11765 [Streptomyces sp. 4N509B]|uniref:hypothetical protein n=1 Tax=Streptomyces sp. 4N509B TaxID=3457413 RepID=UPI003FD3AAB1
MERKGRTLLLAAVGLVVSVPVAVWGLVGQHDAAGVPPAELDYVVRPWDLPDGASVLLGGGATLTALGCAAVLVHATHAGRLHPRRWQVLVPLVLAGAALGAGWRVITAGTIGANIGAGLVILVGGPLVAGLLLWSAVQGLRQVAQRH